MHTSTARQVPWKAGLALVLGFGLGYGIDKQHGASTAVPTSSDRAEKQSLIPMQRLATTQRFEGAGQLRELMAQVGERATELQEARLKVLISDWAENDPAAAMDYLMTSGTPPEIRDRLMHLVAERFGKADLAGGIAWLEASGVSSSERNYLRSSLFAGAAAADPRAALEVAEALSHPQSREEGMTTVLSEWGKSEPQDVFGWLIEQPPQAFFDEVYRSVMTSYVESGGSEAARVVEALSAGPTKDLLASHYGAALAKQDLSQGYEWVDKLEGSARKEALEAVFQEEITQSPSAALARVTELESLSNSSVERLFTALAEQDPVVVERFLEGESNDFSGQAAQALARVKLADNPAEGQIWVENLPAGRARDQAAHLVVDYLADRDAPGAFSFAEQVLSDDARLMVAEGLLERWAKVDEGAARVALQSSPSFSQRDRDYLLGVIRDSEPLDLVIPRGD